MEYQTLYRRWRPHGFSDFVGQNHVVTTLSNAVSTKRIAHAYLFTGPRGTGKTSTAKILAKALNCENLNGVNPCDQCSSCLRINEGTFMDVQEIDAASNRGIDEIRDLREKVKFSPAEGKYKIYIIDEVHMLTAEAFNALLKTLEEPPAAVIFILATTEAHKIPLTILSRCQRFDFKRFSIPEIKGRLSQILAADNIESCEKALELIAEHSEGGMRDAVSLLEQVLAHSGERIQENDVRAILGLINEEEIIRMAQAIETSDTAKALTILSDVSLDGKDLFQFGRSLVEYYRQMLLSLLSESDSNKYKPGELTAIIETLANATNEVKRSLQGALPLELALIRLTTQPNTNDLEARVARLEAFIQGNQQLQSSLVSAGNDTASNSVKSDAIDYKQVNKKTQTVDLIQPEENKKSSEAAFNWEQFLEVVKKKKRTLAALIQEGKPLKYEGGELLVGLPPNLKFHLENLNLPQQKEILEGILKELYGGVVKINCIPLTEGQLKNNSTEPLKNKEPEALTKAVQMFGGEVRPIKKGDN